MYGKIMYLDERVMFPGVLVKFKILLKVSVGVERYCHLAKEISLSGESDGVKNG